MTINSNCTRVDAVKAMSGQLQMQLDQAPPTARQTDNYRRAMSQIQALDGAVKNGNAQQAETALSTAETALKQLQTQDSNATDNQGGLDVYA